MQGSLETVLSNNFEEHPIRWRFIDRLMDRFVFRGSQTLPNGSFDILDYQNPGLVRSPIESKLDRRAAGSPETF